mgnify:CR=1 FL=1
MDFDILYALNNIHTDLLDKVMIGITYLGEKGIFWIGIAIILLFFKKTRKCGIFMLISMAIGVIIGNGIIKNLVARPRPCWIDESINLLISNPKDFSFPSGHTLASFEAAITILLHNKKWGIAAILLAICVGISRLYLFVHFPTDVLAGAILGTIIAIAVYFVSKKVIASKQMKNEKENNSEVEE